MLYALNSLSKELVTPLYKRSHLGVGHGATGGGKGEPGGGGFSKMTTVDGGGSLGVHAAIVSCARALSMGNCGSLQD